MVKFYIRVALVEFLSLMYSFLPSKICKQKFFFYGILRFITQGIREKVTTLDLNRATLVA